MQLTKFTKTLNGITPSPAMASASERCLPLSLSLPPSPVSSRFLFLLGWQGIVALITASGGKKPGKIAARERIIVLVNTGEEVGVGGLAKGRGRKSSC